MTWPIHGLVLRTPRLELRGLTEQLALQLAELLPDDVELDPSLILPDRRQRFLQYCARSVASWSPDDWVVLFAVSSADGLIGLQGLEGKEFAVRREVDTSSWLVPSARGRGLGREMRGAVLALAFGHLGAARAVTEAWEDNGPSLGVSRSLGYLPNSNTIVVRQGSPSVMVGLALTDPELLSVEVNGLSPCLALLGLG